MKMLNMKLSKPTLLMLLSMAVFCSCDKDNNDTLENQEITGNVNEEQEESEYQALKVGNLKTEFEIEQGNYTIAISTNTQEIFDAFQNNGVITKMRSNAELEAFENVEDIDRVDENETNKNVTLKNNENHFIAVSIKELVQDEANSLEITFSDALLAVLKKYRAETIINSEESDNFEKIGKGTVNKNGFTAYGYGERVKLRVYYRYSTTGRRTFYSDTKRGFKNSYSFQSCEWPWENSNRCKYTSFKVTYGRLKSFNSFTTSRCKKCY